MFRIGRSKSTGSRKTQCQKSAKAHGLELSRMQSTISTEPMRADSRAIYWPCGIRTSEGVGSI